MAGEIADTALTEVATVLNDRLGGLTLGEIRSSLGQRLRDTTAERSTSELLNIFVQEGEQLFEAALPAAENQIVLGAASVLAEQPEFSAAGRMRRLIELTERVRRFEPHHVDDAEGERRADTEDPGEVPHRCASFGRQ